MSAPTTAPVVTAVDLARSFGPTAALRGVSLAVAPGETVAVTGSSGSGKSTLLHCLAGLIAPDAGRVEIGGVALATLSDRQRSRLRLARVGVVSQFGELVPELTIAENIELPMRLLRVDRAEAERRTAELLRTLGIEDIARKRAGETSGGQTQRAAIARAVAHRPALVLADEPTGALDTVTGERVLDALLGCARDHGAAVVLVTHDAKVAAHADRHIALRDGAVVGAPAVAR